MKTSKEYFDLINDSLEILRIEKVNHFTCAISDSSGKIFSGFFLAKSPNGKAYTICDVDFYPGSDGKFKPRLVFRRTDDKLQDKKVNSSSYFQRIPFDSSDNGISNFWEMVYFLQSFKEIIDSGEFNHSFATVSNDITIDQINHWYDSNPHECKEILIKLLESKGKISGKDLQNLVNRKQQYEIFKGIVEDNSDTIKYIKDVYDRTQKEKAIEDFFKDNSRILGLSLDSVKYNTIDDELNGLMKIQEHVQGAPEHNFDILSESTTINIVELKLPTEKLFNDGVDSHKNSKWNPKIFEYITQIQNYKRVLEEVAGSSIVPIGKKIIFPNTFLIVGRLSDLNQDQIKILEMYRKNLLEPKIITYDELLERVKKIVNEE